MKYLLFISSTLLIFVTSCKSTQNHTERSENWFNIAVADDVEIYTDTVSIRHEGAKAYAREKRIYITPESRKKYTDKIREEYAKMGKSEKADKWNDFSYCIYTCEYECTSSRFRVLSVQDYDSNGKLIAKTTPNKNTIKWLNVNTETVGDYTFFFVCDYGS